MGKLCTKCKQEKTLSEFYKNKSREDGLQVWCKECSSEHSRRRREENPERSREQSRRSYRKNHEKELERSRKYRAENPGKVRESQNKWESANKARRGEYRCQRYQANREKCIEASLNWRQANIEKCRENARNRYSTPEGKLASNLRSRILYALKSGKAGKSTLEILGVDSFDKVEKHIEAQFQPGMTWENNGRGKGCWHVDHIRPLATAKNKKETLSLCHYENLQPLWEEENLRKNKKFRLEDMFKYYYHNGGEK